MKNFQLTLFVLLFSLLMAPVNAQPGGGNRGGGQNMNMGHFYGKIVDANNKPLEAASVQLIQNKLDSFTKKRKDIVIAGMLTDKKGEFSLENLPVMASFKFSASLHERFKKSFVGFGKKEN